eukprot:maker-scaffold365_size194585-snap-gene-0.25 protein:Tk02277 transcript:maker-scaffold365_size194585-snap-gene-0.25-mRNA-1 annotation:"stage v sporulation protein r"
MANWTHFALLTLAMVVAVQSCPLSGGECGSNSDCCLGYKCGSDSTCAEDSNFSQSLTRSQARSMDPTASEEPTEDKDCYEYNAPVYTFEECKRICFSNNFTLAVWTGAINQCICC